MIRRRIPDKDNAVILRLIQGELLPLTRKNFPKTKFDRHETLQRLKNGNTFVAAKRGHPPVGFIHTFIEGEQLFIDMLAVDSSAQGSGWGSALMDYAEEFGRKRGCKSAYLYVDDHNEKAQRFYGARGYQQQRYLSQVRCYQFGKSLDSQMQHYPVYWMWG